VKQLDIAAVIPFCGLLGAVVGVVRAFSRIAEQNASGLAAVAAGIADTLAATALSLLLAMTLMWGYSRVVKAKK